MNAGISVLAGVTPQATISSASAVKLAISEGNRSMVGSLFTDALQPASKAQARFPFT